MNYGLFKLYELGCVEYRRSITGFARTDQHVFDTPQLVELEQPIVHDGAERSTEPAADPQHLAAPPGPPLLSPVPREGLCTHHVDPHVAKSDPRQLVGVGR